MLTEERLRIIRSLLAERGAVKAAEIARDLRVSRETVRRDLAELERLGELRRVHGGAVLVGHRAFEPPFQSRRLSMVGEKRAIGAAAASLVENGESILVDLGTTALEVVRHLVGKRRFTLITNSVPTALACVDATGVEVHLLGGTLRRGDRAVSGGETMRGLEVFYADKAFVGAGGLTLETGITDYHLEEAAVRREMVARAHEAIVVADHTKFGVTALAAVCPVTAVHQIVTDDGLAESYREALKAAGVNITAVPVPKDEP